MHKGKNHEIYNIGSDEKCEKTVLEVANYLIKNILKTEHFDKHIEFVKDRPFNDKRYFITNKKLKTLGWKQTIIFEEGMANLLIQNC